VRIILRAVAQEAATSLTKEKANLISQTGPYLWAAIVTIYFALAYPVSSAALTVNFCLTLFLLAVIANVAYCAAYIVDVFAQASGFRDIWRRYRKVLFVIGTLFAAIITRFIAMGMFPATTGFTLSLPKGLPHTWRVQYQPCGG
jgi:hypothetical protein